MASEVSKAQAKSIDMSMFKAELKKSQLKSDAEISIFNKLDKNKDGNLSADEVGGTVTGKIKNKNGEFINREYVKVKNLENGRSLVIGADGKEYVMAHDGTILKDSYVKKEQNSKAKTNTQTSANKNEKSGQGQKQTVNTTKEQTKTLNNLIKAHNAAQKAFDKQMEDDGWAGDVADGVSVLWNSDNRATKVREDLKQSKQNIKELKEAAKQSEAAFKAKFESIYGVKYNQKAIDEYNSNPTDENYKKAFGTKQKNITTRVGKYNQSQKTGAVAVKTTAKVGAGIAVGVATGGTGFVAMGTAAIGTAVASAAIEETDRMKLGKAVTEGKVEFREGTDHGQILKDAAWDGAAVFAGGVVAKGATAIAKGSKVVKAAATVTGDVATGAAQEKLQTGDITLEGTFVNATMSGVGSAAEAGVLKRGYQALKGKLGKVTDKVSDRISGSKPSSAEKSQSIRTETASKSAGQTIDSDGHVVAGGLFGDNKTSSGGGLLNRIKTAVGIEPAGMKSLKTRNPENYQMATTRGLADAVDNGKVSQRIYSDLQKDPGNVVSKRMLKALELEQQGKTLVTTLDRSTPLSQISRHVRDGEVCSINGRLYVNDNGTAVPINMSQSKFEKLFPPIGTAVAYQPGGNVCPIVSQINTMMDSASGRVALYQRFEQRGNDIYVHLDGRNNPIRFPGGKPANVPGAQLGENAAPGLEMLNQAVLVQDMSGGGRVSSIADLSPEMLEREAGDLKHSFNRASQALGMEYKKENVISRYGLRAESPTWKADVERELKSFRPGKDTMGVVWEAHARSVVDYNPKTKTVTYHDPYNGGVDTQCSLEEFTGMAAYLYHGRTNRSMPSSGSMNSSGSFSGRSTAAPVSESSARVPGFTPRVTELSNKPYVVARTADGTPIGATVTNINVVIIKDGKRTIIPIPESGTNVPIHETSTDTYLIVKNDNGRVTITTSETPDL